MQAIILKRKYNRKKRSLGLLFFIIILLYSCKTDEKNIAHPVEHFQGKTMGTTYNVKFFQSGKQITQESVDSILVALNNEVSTYIPSSIISILNQSEQDVFQVIEDAYFTDNYKIATDLYELTYGNFDPSLAPLVNFWGFGYTNKEISDKDRDQVPKLMANVGFDKWSAEMNDKGLIISKPAKGKLDFSASAKGYGVDLLAEFLESHDIVSYYVEIGGELRVKGEKKDGLKWTVGVNEPKEQSGLTEVSKVVELKDEAMATSGNYRNFYKEDGITYSHIINPFTGFPERSTLLSATIIHSSCAYADGMATACMVMGKDKCIELLKENKDFQGLLLYSEDGQQINSWQSSAFDSKIVEL